MILLGPDIRFTDSELINAISDGLQGLIGSEFHDLDLGLWIKNQSKRYALLFIGTRPYLVIGEIDLHQVFKGLPVFFSDERQVNAFSSITSEFKVPDFALAQLILKLFHHPLQVTFHRLACINFQDQVHAALEVKAEMYLLLRQKTGPPRWKLAA